MSAIEIKKVASKADLTTFIDFHYSLYKGNAFDAPNLYRDELDTLSSNKNAAFDFCEAAYFLAYKEGQLVGRVAAIINYRANEKWHTKAVRFGWIDFIDDIEVSRALLKAVEDYGRSKGMDNVVGPLGFTDFDPEGMLIEGFDQLGTMATIYNYPYYPQHMEQLGGWRKDNDYVEYKLIVPKEIPEKYTKVAEMIESRYNLHVRAMTKKEVYQGGLGYKVFEIINETFKDLYGYSKLTEKQIYQYIDTYLPYGDLNWMPIVEDWNCDPHKIVGVGLTIPSLSRALQKLHNGRLLPFGWWHILKVLKFHQTNIVDLLLIGVLPEYRVKGANALLFSHLIPIYQKYGIAWGETHVEMETNEKVQNQWQYLETVLHKRRRCYRKDL
ncbi:N-acetyltransferase [Segatella oulorum]|uniref:N-acetyltransferase n=1 Tax=Segatella oulorum TaxID=28136 RepID=UPI0028ED1BB4|nr:N-acetyltransferase [Segatella oulorum]